jgi:hypothetical protein
MLNALAEWLGVSGPIAMVMAHHVEKPVQIVGNSDRACE